jgi:hypothetical protein
MGEESATDEEGSIEITTTKRSADNHNTDTEAGWRY